MKQQTITEDEAILVGDNLGLDWKNIDIQEFRRGLEVELEHGLVNKNSNVTGDDMNLTGKIAMAHLNELSDYYTRLDIVENAKFNVSKLTQNVPNKTGSYNLMAGMAVGVGLVDFITYISGIKTKV